MHNILARARAEPQEIKLEGLALIHAYFWGKDAVGSEPTDPAFRQWLETTWGFMCGWSAGIEDPRLDPAVPGRGRAEGASSPAGAGECDGEGLVQAARERRTTRG